jgi:ribosomal protein S6
MNKYELLVILSAELTDESKEALIKKVTDLIASKGGVVGNVDKQGVKKLTYRINGKYEGYYVLVNFESASSVPNELSKTFNITDNIYRTFFLKK